MHEYLDLIQYIMANGSDRNDRTGIGSRFISGANIMVDLSDTFPIITCRKVSLRIAFEETMMFLRGDTDTKILEEKGVNIWKGNTSRSFLDAQGLHSLPEGSIGTGYSHCWRNFGGTVGGNDGIDQVVTMLENMKINPTSRRHVITAWNPTQLHQTPLPPCHLMHMYSVDPTSNLLNSCFIMRSNDVPFGLPYNFMGYALLNMIFAKYLGLMPGSLSYYGWDAHIYNNQFDFCEELLTRQPSNLCPQLTINKDINTIDDMMSLEFTDLILDDYDPLPDIQNKPRMAV